MHSVADVIDELTSAIRGEGAWVIRTPSHINGDMWPTDHAILLHEYIYPLCERLGCEVAQKSFELALIACTTDTLGIFCAHQCFYMQIVNEAFNKSPFHINKAWLPQTLYSKMIEFETKLSTWSNPQYKHAGDALKLIKARISILNHRHGIRFVESDACPST